MITKTAERTDLSRTSIVDRALAVADLEGTDAVTVRRLAQEFGVTPMALYWHVKNKDELLGSMGDRFFDEIGPVPASGTWTERLRSVLTALIGSLRQHPASAHLAGPRVLVCAAGQELAEQTLDLLRAAGFSITQATDIARSVMQTAIMLVTEQAGAEPGVPEDKRDEVRAAKHAALAGLPPDRFPNLVACAAALTECDDEQEYYDFGRDLFIAGVDRLHASLKRRGGKVAQ